MLHFLLSKATVTHQCSFFTISLLFHDLEFSQGPRFFNLVLSVSITFWTADCVIACLFLHCNVQNNLNCNGHKNTCRIEKLLECKVILQYVATGWDKSRNFGLKAVEGGRIGIVC